MASSSKRKGSRIEREIVELHKAAGIDAERIPLSGAAGGSFTGDVRIDGIGVAEVKARANGKGFATLERWLGDHAALFLRRDRSTPLVLLPWGTYLKLIQGGVINPSIDDPITKQGIGK
jgi:Holliday junction resolvase